MDINKYLIYNLHCTDLKKYVELEMSKNKTKSVINASLKLSYANNITKFNIYNVCHGCKKNAV